jgi:hypothetical protein
MNGGVRIKVVRKSVIAANTNKQTDKQKHLKQNKQPTQQQQQQQ